MKTYLIERLIPGAGDLTAEQLKGISQTSCSVLKEMGSNPEGENALKMLGVDNWRIINENEINLLGDV